ncbi:unnamed protein product [Trichobilharzia regenti]|nr:unnamed protein product [Trichobilharzia regenti]
MPKFVGLSLAENRYPNIKDNNGDNDDESILGKWSDMFDPDVNILVRYFIMPLISANDIPGKNQRKRYYVCVS